MTIHQGHPYRLGDVKVIALESCPDDAQTVRVGVVGEYWFREEVARPDWLEPMPLRYLGGEHAE